MENLKKYLIKYKIKFSSKNKKAIFIYREQHIDCVRTEGIIKLVTDSSFDISFMNDFIYVGKKYSQL